MLYRFVQGVCVCCVLVLVGCTQVPVVEQDPEVVLDLRDLSYTPVIDAATITVNGNPITIPNRLAVGDVLNDILLDRPVDVFDKIETVSLFDLDGYTMIYSVPSLDTPVCTLQTKQIESAAKHRTDINFVIVSHDTPFALNRFCVNNDIANVLTLSDSRRKDFAQDNGLYMAEFDLMARAVLIVDPNLNVIYIDYADEVTSPVDLLNAFAALDELRTVGE